MSTMAENVLPAMVIVATVVEVGGKFAAVRLR
jgi:hypothetical protein